MTRKGDWMTTYTGRQFWPLDPRTEEVFIEDIAHALSLVCRFGGHCGQFYSVAQHSCVVASIIEANGGSEAAVLRGLLHDAAEAYIGDLIRPIKKYVAAFCAIEEQVECVIMQRFDVPESRGADGVPTVDAQMVKWADDVALANEHRCLIKDGKVWDVDSTIGMTIEIVPQLPAVAEVVFIAKFADKIHKWYA